MIKIEKGTLQAILGMSLILFDYHLASNLTSILLAYNWVFLDSHLLNSNSVGTNYTVPSYYLQFEPDISKLLTAVLLPSGFLYGRIFLFFCFLIRKYSSFGLKVLLLHET